jgi:hypothetical protein
LGASLGPSQLPRFLDSDPMWLVPSGQMHFVFIVWFVHSCSPSSWTIHCCFPFSQGAGSVYPKLSSANLSMLVRACFISDNVENWFRVNFEWYTHSSCLASWL